MAYDIDTLDRSIKEKATQELRDRVKESFRTVRNLASVGYALEVQIPIPKSDATAECSVHDLLGRIEKKIVEHYLPDALDKAVSDFLKKVDGLQSQLDELKHQFEANASPE